ncbi:MAG: PIN domain-containing protein [Proteobacteria bacterium]|nr:PIN domain-containing protein [Pseudomonadota bacterium]
MPYRALTIDTNVAYGGGFDFEHGLLRQLQQFHGTDGRFILSVIVEAEILKRLREMTSSTRDKFVSVTQDAFDRRLLGDDFRQAADTLTAALVEPRAAARAHLDDFLQTTGATLVPVDLAPMADLVGMYFDSTAPFEASGAKKAEFPDAIALLSLDACARRNGKVLAVSRDKGWREFAEQTIHLDVVESLGAALAVFQEQAAAEKAAKSVGAVLGRVRAGELQDLAAELTSRLEMRTEELDPDISADSHHQLDFELTGLAFNSYVLAGEPDDDFDVTVVRIEDGLIAVTAPVLIRATVQASFHLLHWDSIDREYISLGNQYEEREAEFSFDALISLVGDINELDTLQIDDVELVNGSADVDFGEIEIDRCEG